MIWDGHLGISKDGGTIESKQLQWMMMIGIQSGGALKARSRVVV
jgi:hypothetical protein